MKNKIFDLDRDRVLGLAIDFQDKLFPVMKDKEELESNLIKLCKGLEVLKLPIMVTQQYTRGLGHTIDSLKAVIEDFSYYEKDGFSALEGKILTDLEKSGRKQIVLFGIETHICVQQTAMGLLERGYEVYLAADCCSSRRDLDKKLALANMRRAGCFVTSTESILFDIMKTSRLDEFKAISSIIK